MNIDEFYMKKCLNLAKKASGKTNPNPLVGSVIVKNGEIISTGYHKGLGLPHAEIDAISNAKVSLEGSTMYINLEPCSHFGRTPPCANAIVDAKISKVVIAMTDPNPKVLGKGIKILKDAGIEVITNVLEEEAMKLNEIFIKYILKRKPFVILKSAMTLDGKIATKTYDSKWISCDKSREYSHKLRNRVSAIMVGINTVLNDDPMLNVRIKGKNINNPYKIIVDSYGKIDLNSNIIRLNPEKVIFATTESIDVKLESSLKTLGVKVIKTPFDENNSVDLNYLMDELYKLEIDSVLLEGGGSLNYSMIKNGLIDKVLLFIAPKIIGGKNAITAFEGEGLHFIKDAVSIKNMKVMRFDEDIAIEGYI